jgi:hypothetical protein
MAFVLGHRLDEQAGRGLDVFAAIGDVRLKIYSPASYTKGYLRALGIKPPLERNRDFPTEVMGYSMRAPRTCRPP